MISTSKPEGWGLSGGRMEFPNSTDITVKNLTFNSEGQLLLVLERYIEAQKEKPQKNFEEALKDMGNLIALLQNKRSNIKWDEINHLLNTAIPKSTSFLDTIKALFIKTETGDWKIDPGLAHSWDSDSEKIKIILTAIREELEETGLLIRPEPMVEIPAGIDHKVVICYTTEIVSGRLKKESKEIKQAEWFPLDHLPPTADEADTQGLTIQRSETMYWKHKNIYIPRALRAIKAKGYPLPCSAETIENFLRSRPQR